MANQDRSYWLGGEQECQHCQQAYTFAVERICTHCDGPACPHCVTTIAATRELICTRCETTDEIEDPRGS